MRIRFTPQIQSIAQFVFGFLILFLAFSEPFHVNASEPPPSTQVEQFHDVLLSVMKDADQLGILGRYKKLEPALSQVFSLKAMIQIASGSFWKRTSDQEKTQLTSAFSRLTIATYATQFDGFSGQLFKTIGAKPGPQKTTLVETQIVNTDTSSVTLRYVFREIKGQWRVIDVLLDTGFSELARKRSEYRSVLKTGGVAGLIALLNAKTDSLLAN